MVGSYFSGGAPYYSLCKKNAASTRSVVARAIIRLMWNTTVPVAGPKLLVLSFHLSVCANARTSGWCHHCWCYCWGPAAALSHDVTLAPGGADVLAYLLTMQNTHQVYRCCFRCCCCCEIYIMYFKRLRRNKYQVCVNPFRTAIPFWEQTTRN